MTAALALGRCVVTALDVLLLATLDARCAVVKRIAAHKSRASLPAHDAERERLVIQGYEARAHVVSALSANMFAREVLRAMKNPRRDRS